MHRRLKSNVRSWSISFCNELEKYIVDSFPIRLGDISDYDFQSLKNSLAFYKICSFETFVLKKHFGYSFILDIFCYIFSKVKFSKFRHGNFFQRFVWIAAMGKGKKKGQVQDDWENEMEEIAAEATGSDLTFVTTGQFLSSNEKVLFKDWDEKQFFMEIRVGFFSIACRVSIFKWNSCVSNRSFFWILRLCKQY